MRPRCLITGATGFIGKHLSASLQQFNLDVIKAGHVANDDTTYVADITDLNAVRHLVLETKPNFVVHLAGISQTNADITNEYFSVNAIGTSNLLQALAPIRERINKVAIFSSSHVYGTNTDTPLAETNERRPRSTYALSKSLAEEISIGWQRQLPVMICRPFNIIGVGQPKQFFMSKLTAAFQSHEQSLSLGNLNIYRDFLDIRDFSALFSKVLQNTQHYDVLNFCRGKAYKLADILNIFSEITGHKPAINIDEKFVRGKEATYIVGNTDLLIRAAGSHDFIDIRNTIDWMLHN